MCAGCTNEMLSQVGHLIQQIALLSCRQSVCFLLQLYHTDLHHETRERTNAPTSGFHCPRLLGYQTGQLSAVFLTLVVLMINLTLYTRKKKCIRTRCMGGWYLNGSKRIRIWRYILDSSGSRKAQWQALVNILWTFEFHKHWRQGISWALTEYQFLKCSDQWS